MDAGRDAGKDARKKLEGEGENVRPRVSSGGGKNRVREEKNMREAMGRKRVPRILGFRLRLLHVHTHAAFTYATFVYVRVCVRVCVS